MDIDSAASTPIIKDTGDPADTRYLRHELTGVGYYLAERLGVASVRDSLQTACRAAAIAASRPGVMDSIPKRDEVDAFAR